MTPGPSTSVRQLSYLDFELDIGSAVDGVYPLAVIRSPGGEQRATLRLPFDVGALNDKLPLLTETLMETRDFVLPESPAFQPDLPPHAQSARMLGQALFDALLPDDLNNIYDVSLQIAEREGKGLRIKLRIEPPELALLPWEYLYDRRRDEYVCLSRSTPVVRYVEQPQPIPPLAVSPPLRILGVVANPSDLGQLDVAHEQRRLEDALTTLKDAGIVELVWLQNPTWRDLQQTIWQNQWHIFHFIGHGSFDQQSGSGSIALTNAAGTSESLSATQLARLLGDHDPLRLALLNACQGARGNSFNLFSSTAASLVRRGTPAVVAMQYPISDVAAIEFARTFYEALAAMLPIDTAVAEARKAISFTNVATTEWGVPVLFMRSPDGVIFTRPESASAPARIETLDTLLAELGAAENEANWDQAIALGRRILQVDAQHQTGRSKLIAAYTARGQRLYRRRDGAGALADFDAALTLDPSAPLGYWRGLCYGLQGDQERATAEIAQAVQQLTATIAQEPQRPDAYITLGQCYLWQEQYPAALTQLTRAIELGAISSECYTARGQVYAANGSYQQALADLGRAIELDPQRVEAYAVRGACFNHLGDYQRAVHDLTQAITLDPDNGAYAVARAGSYDCLGHYDRAIADLTRALELDAANAEVYYLRGMSYHQAVFHGHPIGDYERAINDFSQALTLDPQSVEAYAARGNSYYQAALRHDDSEAIEHAVADFTKAIELSPPNGELYYARGLAYKQQRNRDAAQADFKQAIGLGFERATSELGWWQRLFM